MKKNKKETCKIEASVRNEENFRRSGKKDSGITLVALVITRNVQSA